MDGVAPFTARLTGSELVGAFSADAAEGGVADAEIGAGLFSSPVH